MKSTFDFTEFSKIETKKVKEVENQLGKNYVYMLLQNYLSTRDIDFEGFTIDDLWDVYNEMDEVITNDDEEGRISVDPNHTYTRLWALSEKIVGMDKLPKFRPSSPYLFL